MRCGGAAVAWRVVQVWLDAIGAKGLRLRGVEWQAACEVQPRHGACSGPGARARAPSTCKGWADLSGGMTVVAIWAPSTEIKCTKRNDASSRLLQLQTDSNTARGCCNRG